jgi:hypothetical protein
MDGEHFDGLVRTFDSRSRRGLLGGLSGVAVAFSLATRLSEARKRRHRHKKRPKTNPPLCPECPSPPPSPPAPTCAATCPDTCYECFIRPGAPTLCGNGKTVNCANPCSSDQSCLQNTPARPYCVSQSVVRSTGETHDIGEVFGVTYSCCISITAC